MSDQILGTGLLSPAARARLARDQGPPLRPPSLDDPSAVKAWRHRIHQTWLEGDPTAADCDHQVDQVGGVRVLRAGSGPLVVYFHGGGFALGSPEVALPITERLAQGCEVVSVDYRLAPEHPCPAAIDDGQLVVAALSRAEPNRPIVLAGDSAGASIALSVALRSPAGRGPTAIVMFSPHVDHQTSSTSVSADRGRRPSDLDAVARRWLARAYRGSLAEDDVQLSPSRGPLGVLAQRTSLLIQVGTVDTALEQGLHLARRARAAGVSVDLDVWDGLWHTWHYHRDLPEADEALAEAVDFINRATQPAAGAG